MEIAAAVIPAYFLLFGAAFCLRIRWNGLQYRLCEMQARLDAISEQSEFKKDMEAKYASILAELEERVNRSLREASSSSEEAIEEHKAEFSDKLKAAFEQACEKIDFDVVEYKKTITKRRKEFGRKHAKDAVPQKIWRYLDEE